MLLTGIMSSSPSLARRIGLVDAVTLGLASMIGAGVFVVFAPAAEVAGSGLLIGLGIAAIVAACNALSSAQLAATYPSAGGAYVYGREQLGEWAGFLAGWSFVVGKTASCAAMALAFATYVAPDGWERPIALAAVVALVAINCIGITRTALAARIIVGLVIAVLIGVLIIAVSAPTTAVVLSSTDLTGYGILQSAGLLFFAFAGFARLATLGEEVRSPAKTIPRAIIIALAIVVTIYVLVALALLVVLGPRALADSTAPLIDLVTAAGQGQLAPVVIGAAALATLGALLALIAGVSRTVLAMARGGDLPSGLASVHPRFVTPVRAELLIGLVVGILVLTTDLRQVIAFSSFGVLLYYFVANIAALSQRAPERRFPRAVSVLGATGCVVLAATLPWQAVVGGTLVLAVGVGYRVIRQRWLASHAARD